MGRMKRKPLTVYRNCWKQLTSTTMYQQKLSIDPSSQSLSQLVQELIGVLKEENENLELEPYFAHEPNLESIALVSHTLEAQAEDNVVSNNNKHLPETTVKSKAAKKFKSNIDLAPNFHCTLCESRLYPVRNFFRSGRLPLLVLHYNGIFSVSVKKALPTPRDRSKDYIFNTQAEDQLFGRMLGKLGLSLEDLYYQEYPACHFNASRSTPEDWQEWLQNCTQHVGNTIKKYQIRKIILCGNAAPALLGQKEAQQAAKTCRIFPLRLGKHCLDCVVLRSPAALLALEKQRKQAKDSQERNTILDQEKAIKSNILKALKEHVSPLC